MKIKSIILTLGLSLLPFVALAGKPERCPDVAALAAVGVDVAGQGTNIWMAFPSKPNSYGTNQMWSFGIYVPAATREEAVKNGNENIPTLGLSSDSPYHDDDDPRELWTCEYGSPKEHVIAFAFTPPLFVGQNFKRKF